MIPEDWPLGWESLRVEDLPVATPKLPDQEWRPHPRAEDIPPSRYQGVQRAWSIRFADHTTFTCYAISLGIALQIYRAEMCHDLPGYKFPEGEGKRIVEILIDPPLPDGTEVIRP